MIIVFSANLDAVPQTARTCRILQCDENSRAYVIIAGTPVYRRLRIDDILRSQSFTRAASTAVIANVNQYRKNVDNDPIPL